MKINRTKAIHLLLGLALTLGLTLCLTGPAMAQTTATYTDVSSWADLQEAINGSSTKTYLRLSEDITAMSTQEALTIRQRKDIVLDLNGKTLSRGLSEAQTNGHVIGITDGGKLFIEDSSNGNGKITGGNTSGNGGGVSVSVGGTFTMDGGSIERNSSTGYGGGVSVSNGGTFTMENGAIQNNNGRYGGGASVAGIGSNITMKESATISDNNSSSEGGGVCVYGGHAQFIMYDGSIEGNSSFGDGGGVSVSNDGTFNMSGGTISENTSLNGSGVKVGIGGTFNMTAGSIQKNTASSQGGGVYLNGLDTQFKLEGGTVSGNKATLSGGGVYTTHGTITMSGGEIKENTSQDGGGVNVGSNGTLAMIGGLISGNTATYRGGGVYLYDSGTQMTMSGGTIQNNTAGSYGGGIYAGKSFTLQGTPTITDNTVNSNANNVYLNNFAGPPYTINIGSNFTPSSKIGVTLVKSFKVFTSGASFADDAAAQAVFISDTPAYEVCAKSGQAALIAVHFNLWVGDDQEVTGDHLANDTRTWSFNPWTNTLTLENFTYSGSGHGQASSQYSNHKYVCI